MDCQVSRKRAPKLFKALSLKKTNSNLDLGLSGYGLWPIEGHGLSTVLQHTVEVFILREGEQFNAKHQTEIINLGL